jgi:hypothetical protein
MSTPDRPIDPKYDGWPIEGEEGHSYQYVGTTDDGRTILVDTADGLLADATVDETRQVLSPDLGTERDLTDDVGEYVEAFADEHGIDRLSAFAREHLDDDESGSQ